MPSTLSATLQKRIKDLREVHDLTQEGFAELSGIAYKYYQAIEQGKKRDLRLSTLERIARAYNIEVWELLAPAMPVTRVAKKISRKRRKKSAAGRK